MASAAILGLAALVLTPRCVATSDDVAHAVHVAARAPLAAVELPATAADRVAAAAPEAEATPQIVAKVAPALAPAPAPGGALAPAPLATPVARVAVSMGSSALDARHVAPHKAEKTVLAAHSSVHGGLSNPGF
jgi:hypothetical protein